MRVFKALIVLTRDDEVAIQDVQDALEDGIGNVWVDGWHILAAEVEE